jgi:hypothetical protein
MEPPKPDPLDELEAELERRDPELYKELADITARAFEGIDEDTWSGLTFPVPVEHHLSLDPEIHKAVEALGSKPVQRKPSRGGKRSVEGAIESVKKKVRAFRAAKIGQQEICKRLGDSPRPPNAAWKDHTWLAAFMNPSSRNAVKSWLSRV